MKSPTGTAWPGRGYPLPICTQVQVPIGSSTRSAAYGMTQHNVAGVQYEGLTKCTGAEVLLNGTPCAVEPYDPYQINQWQTADGDPIFRLDLRNNAPNIMLYSSNLKDGDSLVIHFHYEYTDQDTQYTLTVQHQFFADHSDLTPVYTETEAPLKLHAGDPFTVLAQTSADELTIQKDIPGYQSGTWQLGLTRLEGGVDNSFIGRFTDMPNDYEASNTMIHSDAALVFEYFYIPPTGGGNPPVVTPPEDDEPTIIPPKDDEPTTDLPEEETPTTDLPDEDTPTTQPPAEETPQEDPSAELPEEDVPMAEAPATGDASLLWLAAAVLSGSGLAWLALSERKRREQE